MGAVRPLGCGFVERRGSPQTIVQQTATPEEEGLQGVFKRLRRNGHQKKKRGYRVCSSGYAATDTSDPPGSREEEEGLHGVHKRLRRDKHPRI
jgi:hypothetical protein